MPLLHLIALQVVLLPLEVPDLLQEPGYFIARDGERWVVRKPATGARKPVTISQHPGRNAAEFRRRSLPRLRLGGLFVRFDPVTYERTVVADWRAEEDAKAVEADVREIVKRFAPAGAQALLQSTSVYMARLFGATGHTAEESTDFTRFVIYLDPFRATGRLHAAATLVHELTHLERYRARGFHANRAAAVLPKADFVLLGLSDEFAAYQAEANLVRSFFESQSGETARRAVREAVRNPSLHWPDALSSMLGFEGPPNEGRRILEARRHVVLDLARNAGSYWEARRMDPLDPALRQTISAWYKRSREWREIQAERPEWTKADVVIRGSIP